MIRSTFSLKSMPFSKDLVPKHVFYNDQYREMKSRLMMLFENRGIGLFTGEVGCGKSTLIRITTAGLNTQLYKPVYLYKNMDKIGPFYNQIALQLGLLPRFRKTDVADQVTTLLAELANQQKIRTILIIDEAHLLKPEILDEIRLLHNAEMDSADYLATALVGQPSLRNTLAFRKYLPLAQRISVSFHLDALSKEDSYKYFEHHLKIAGAAGTIFRDNAVETTVIAAKGIPRVINNIALKAMYAAVQNKMTTVDQECVMMALNELGLK